MTHADRILEHVKTLGREFTAHDVRHLFSSKTPLNSANQALRALQAAGKVRRVTVGRPCHPSTWRVVR